MLPTRVLSDRSCVILTRANATLDEVNNETVPASRTFISIITVALVNPLPAIMAITIDLIAVIETSNEGGGAQCALPKQHIQLLAAVCWPVSFRVPMSGDTPSFFSKTMAVNIRVSDREGRVGFGNKAGGEQ
ncbi:hypothetical protein RRG08_045708 [Elysia crispata]|uniref:Uncharacterized protein n=1 Tax=Elysia crispata TaxID=231223 RepID=A0AAE0Z399_9GAST|nr:hypothetical protein RRG08_045708 [Elysia crispata]